MANEEAKLTVSVEQVVHKTVRDLAETILEDYGIFIDAVNIDWIDTSTTAQSDGKIASIELLTTTKR